MKSNKSKKTHLNTLNTDEQNNNTAIVAFVLERVDLFIDKNKQVFLRDKTTNEVWHLFGRQFRDWLVSSYYEENQKIIRHQSLIESLSALAGIGRKLNNQQEINVRVAMLQGIYYLDLGQHGNSKAVKLTAGKGEIIDSPPVMFVRPDSMLAIPDPNRRVEGATLILTR
jgi:hypothetical protein